MNYKDYIDARNIDLKNEDHRQYLKDRIEHWIELNENVIKTTGMFDIWNNNILYYEGYQCPVGFNEDWRKVVSQLNSKGLLDTTQFRLKKDEQDNVWFTNNKIGLVTDSVEATLTEARKEISVKSDDYPGNDGIENGVRQYLEYISKKKQLWEQLWIPCIRTYSKLGLSWYDFLFDHRKNPPVGDITFNLYHPKDVYFDIYSKEMYYRDKNYIVKKKKLPIEEAIRYLTSKPFNISIEDISADVEYDTFAGNYQGVSQLGTDEFVTLYFVEYRQLATEKKRLSEHYGIAMDDELHGDEIEFDTVYHYDAIYNRKLGVIYHAPSKYIDHSDFDNDQFATIPFYNKQSGVRIHPISDIEKLIIIQDAINITNSLVINNARQKNKLRAIVKRTLKDKYGDLFEQFLNVGNVTFPVDEEDDVRKAFDFVEFPDIPSEIPRMLEMFESTITSQGIIHESLAGEMPHKGNISGVAVSRLQERNLGRIGYKFTNINWATTQGGRRIYKMIAEEFTHEEYLRNQKIGKAQAKATPLNVVLTIEQYENFLKESYPGMDPEAAAQHFEEHNSVEIQYTTKDLQGNPLPPDVIRREKSLVFINFMKDYDNKPWNLDVSVSVDYEATRNEMENTIIATEMRKNNEISLSDYYDFLPGPFRVNKDKLIDNLMKERRALQLAKEIEAKGPEAEQFIEQSLQKYDEAKQQQEQAAKQQARQGAPVQGQPQQQAVAAQPSQGGGQ